LKYARVRDRVRVRVRDRVRARAKRGFCGVGMKSYFGYNGVACMHGEEIMVSFDTPFYRGP